MKTRVIELMARKQLELKKEVDANTLIRDTGLSRPTVSKWIRGNIKSFDEQTILKLCNYFKCDVGDLLTIVIDDGDKTPSPDE